MPCAEGELCQLPDTTPQDPHVHGCQGGCGGRLHGICGSLVDEGNENHRICSACLAKAGKRKVSAADSTGKAQSKRSKATNGGSKKSQPRARPDFNSKCEMLKLMDQKVTHEQIADRFKCSERLVRDVKKNRKKYEAEAGAGRGGSTKNLRASNYPEVDAIALGLLEKARKTKMPVTRDVLRSFGRAARATLLADPAASKEVKAKVEDFKAGERWARNFVKRNSIDSVRLHGEAGTVDTEAIKEAMEELRARRVPPAYGELSSHFGVLEAAAEESGNGEAALYLAKAKMAMIAAHSKRRVRQADMREFVAIPTE